MRLVAGGRPRAAEEVRGDGAANFTPHSGLSTGASWLDFLVCTNKSKIRMLEKVSEDILVVRVVNLTRDILKKV